MTVEKFSYIYLLSINILTFFLFGLDKLKAKLNAWRISERTLLVVTFFGGFGAAWLSMVIFRHKIKDRSFLPFIILISMIWIIGIIVFLKQHY